DVRSSLELESLILRLFACDDGGASRTRAIPPRWLARVRERLHEDAGSRCSLAELAAGAGVHPVYLAASFRRCYGTTVAAYVRQVRIELACRELAARTSPSSRPDSSGSSLAAAARRGSSPTRRATRRRRASAPTAPASRTRAATSSPSASAAVRRNASHTCPPRRR